MTMSVPQGTHTLDAYVVIVTSSLKRAIATSFVTVVVFDNQCDTNSMESAKRIRHLEAERCVPHASGEHAELRRQQRP